MIQELPEIPLAIGGLTHGADPIIVAVMMKARQRGLRHRRFLRPQRSQGPRYQEPIENAPKPGTKVVVVDDVVTEGGSILKAIDEAERAGAKWSPPSPWSTAKKAAATKSAPKSRSIFRCLRWMISGRTPPRGLMNSGGSVLNDVRTSSWQESAS